MEPGSTPTANAAMAATAGVSVKTIQQAKVAQEAGLGDAVRDGLVTVKQAAEIAKLPEAERQAAVAAPKIKVKADPKVKAAPDPDEVRTLRATIADQVEGIKELAEALNEAELARDTATGKLLQAEVVIADQAKKIENLQGNCPWPRGS